MTRSILNRAHGLRRNILRGPSHPRGHNVHIRRLDMILRAWVYFRPMAGFGGCLNLPMNENRQNSQMRADAGVRSYLKSPSGAHRLEILPALERASIEEEICVKPVS